MYESLANHVMNLPREKVSELFLDDIALCAAWYESHHDNPEVQESYKLLRQIFDIWVTEVKAPRTDTMGYRQQPLSRALIKELSEGNVTRLERDELDFLSFAAGLARRSGKLDLFRRTMGCLAPHTRDIEHARKHKPVIPGCPALHRRLAVLSAEELKSAEMRDVRTFGGINHPIRGPVCMREGDLLILSDVPPDCTVVVDKGSCYVRGDVQGNVATTVGCEIMGNLAGVVVARRGSVGAKDILNQATVISKENSVRAMAAENPRMIFAAREIEITGNAIGGRYFGRKITVGGDFVGGELFATEWAEAANFVCTEERNINICLLRGLSCQDYGEVLTLESGRMLNSAMKLRQRLANVEELIEITEREADNLAGNVLMYILGEESTKEQVHHVEKLRRKLSFLERLLSGIRSVMVAAEDRLNLMASMKGNGAEASSGSAEEQATLDDLRRELTMLSNEGSIDTELQADKEEVLYLGRKLQRKGLAPQGVEQVLSRLLAKCDEVQEKFDALAQAIARDEQEIERAMGRAALLERAKAECSRVEMLRQLLAAARKRPDADLFKMRANDRYVKVLLRTMEIRMSRVTGYLASCREIAARIEELRERLWTEYMVSLPDHVLQGWAVGGARARGCFTPGIVICAWRHLLDEEKGMGRSRIVTKAWENGIPARQTYLRTEKSTIETLGEPEPLMISGSINV
ncbi:MAG: hypothetical protein JNK74_23285 [Candidatus Hydrogenedentes bacterium]|nr:hypothetical protein [Candidatus Hydrogenedentota bacterium]